MCRNHTRAVRLAPAVALYARVTCTLRAFRRLFTDIALAGVLL